MRSMLSQLPPPNQFLKMKQRHHTHKTPVQKWQMLSLGCDIFNALLPDQEAVHAAVGKQLCVQKCASLSYPSPPTLGRPGGFSEFLYFILTFYLLYLVT